MINWLFLICGVLCALYYVIMGVTVRFGQSMLWVWLVAGAALILRFVIVQISISRGEPLPYPMWFIVSLRCACALGLAAFLTVEGFVYSGTFAKPAESADYVLILGAKVGSKALDNRIKAAGEYLLQNPDSVAIASGGRGADEPVAEGEYIKQELIRLGISEDRVIVESESTSTAENFRFAAALIEKDDCSLVVVTNDFHMYRSLKIAKRCGIENVSGLVVSSSALSFPHYMLREFFTTVVDTLRGNT